MSVGGSRGWTYAVLAGVSSGVLQYLAHPGVGISVAVLLAWVPLILFVEVVGGWLAVAATFLGGAVAWGLALSWLPLSLSAYGAAPAATAWGAAAVTVAAQALGPSVAVAVAARARQHALVVVPLCLALADAFVPQIVPYSPSSGLVEHSILLGPLPIGGRHLLGLVIYSANAVVAGCAISVARRGDGALQVLRLAILVVTAWVACWVVPDGTLATNTLKRVLLVQQNERWSLARSGAARVRYHVEATEHALERQTPTEPVDVVIWGESVLGRVSASSEKVETPAGLVAAAQRWGIAVLTGATVSYGSEHWNSILALVPRSEGGCVRCRYDKRDLVPFAEWWPSYWPWRHQADRQFFTPGRASEPLDAAGLRWGTTICFEGVSERSSRDVVAAGADVLLNVASDAWLHDEGARDAHRALAVLAAVESGRELVRLASAGPSVRVGYRGNVEVVIDSRAGAGVAVVQPRAGRTPHTNYGRWGFIVLTAAYSAVALFLTRRSVRT